MAVRVHKFNCDVSLFPNPGENDSVLIKLKICRVYMVGMGQPMIQVIAEKEVYFDQANTVGGIYTRFQYPLIGGISLEEMDVIFMSASANGYDGPNGEEWVNKSLVRVGPYPDGSILAVGLVSLDQIQG